ncbi:hypothetical protein IV203_019912 [Nitzschia inconspicua]|uniref:Uncharacterized protein n=1 Tax=Nitzschia inconspicua TaxID=303405 RepID=A0A9K3M000_9STRA|nr:hypothetical protein IV203_019912 [Nitzschia inconspicua]
MAGNTNDDFLQSMTFATAGEHIRSCDCDECGNIPLSILAALRERKRQRLETGPMKRTQHRELIQRYGTGVSVYRITMTSGASPLVEFGNSHRVVWIQRKPAGTYLYSIGKGIIGSSDEEESRLLLEDWKEGKVILVPSNGGKAVGWIYHNDKTDKDRDNGDTNDKGETATKSCDKELVSSGPAVVIVAKITQEKLKELEDDTTDEPDWVQGITQCCQESIQEWSHSGQDSREDCPYHDIPDKHANKLKEYLQRLLDQHQ